ncbi:MULTISPECIES: translation initiation factor [Arcobacteraceae]|uniref:translation initiation factor n=1 Tax=Arcobacteraceae TaxID=2808963 RepID=UPI000DE97D43|nr:MULTISPECIES: translation initiation factor [Arcobacteraceae]MBL3521020.1 translation initiation factor [Aliarcobacter lanthieri]RBQ27243.1 translation initiation factor SUI1 [Arcobacter sp. CECT 9188]
MSLSSKLALGLGAKLDGNNFDTKKEDKKNPKKEEKTLLAKNQHQLVFSFEKRNGKPVTIVGRFQIEDEKRKDILKLLKTQLACGGSIKGENIEIQGELKDKIRIILVDNGWKFKN